jgi:hypothetical protein
MDETTNKKMFRPIRSREQEVDHFNYTLLLYLLLALANYAKMLGHFAKPNKHALIFLHPILMGRVTCRAQLGMLLESNHYSEYNNSKPRHT